MNEMIIEFAIQILGELAMAAIGVAGVWVLGKVAKHKELENISIATSEAVYAAQQTAAALQQTLVEGMKAAHEDGKLTADEVEELGVLLLELAMKKLSDPAKNILIAAGKDITIIIRDAAEAWIAQMKGNR